MNLIIGSHVSYKNDTQLLGSVKAALSYDANAFMFYTGAPQNTSRSTINDDLTKEAYNLMTFHNLKPENVIVHAPYIINLANIDNFEFSVSFLTNEIERCYRLGMKYLVLHPGSAVNCSKETAIKLIANGLNLILEKNSHVMILLETMAGKGHEIGANFEELRDIISKVNNKKMIGVCLDTCHLNDAGYSIENFDTTLEEFDRILGIDKIKCVHVNDSKNILGSHKDRHENIGFGTIGFENLLKVIYHKKLEEVPKILETPYVAKDDDSKEKIYPPYKWEIAMIRKGKFNSELISKIRENG